MSYPIIPDIPPQGGATYATLQNAVTSSGNGTVLNVKGMASVVFGVITTGFSGSVAFQGSVDNTNWNAIETTLSGTATVETGTGSLTTDTSNYHFIAPIAGFNYVRAVVTRSAGSVTVVAETSAQSNGQPVTGTIGTAVIQANSGQSTTATADGATAANILLAAAGKFNGATIDRERIITKFCQLQAVAITHATPVDVLTPTSGKKFRILGYQISSTIASAIQFEDGTGNEVLRTPILAAAGVISSGNMGNGILSGAANTHLFLDATVTTNVSGWIAYCEE